nr:HlyD family efflux transporter periplasmic adaptor subunit [uncultured Roseococcus sp.]
MTNLRRRLLLSGGLVALAGGGYLAWTKFGEGGLPAGIASGNGRIEAVEIDISTKIPGRIREILVNEGDFVEAGQVLARMDAALLMAQHREAQAQLQRAQIAIGTAGSLVAQREAEHSAAAATVAQREAERDAANARRQRTEQLARTNNASLQLLDDDRARALGAEAALGASRAQLAATEAAINAARSQVVDARSAVEAARATIERIEVDIADGELKAPRDGRVQYRVAQPGEVLAAGGRVLNLVDLGDVYMNFFLPAEQAGLLAYGAEVRLVLDAAPQYIIPATISFVADVAQFTPRSVETAQERQKLMFRVKARIAPELLRRYIRQVKAGIPGVAYVRLVPDAPWPASLTGTLVQ